MIFDTWNDFSGHGFCFSAFSHFLIFVFCGPTFCSGTKRLVYTSCVILILSALIKFIAAKECTGGPLLE